MKTLVGKAAIYGIDGKLAYSGVASTKTQLGGVSLSAEANVGFLQGTNADTIGAAASNQRETLSIDFVPTAAPGDQTYAGGVAALQKPANLAIVTLSEFGHLDFDGDWNFGGSWTVGFTPEGYVRATMNLLRFNNAALTPITGVPG
jgi:hypothetical protein